MTELKRLNHKQKLEQLSLQYINELCHGLMSESDKDKIIKYRLSTANELNNSENGFKCSYTTSRNTLTDA